MDSPRTTVRQPRHRARMPQIAVARGGRRPWTCAVMCAVGLGASGEAPRTRERTELQLGLAWTATSAVLRRSERADRCGG